METADASLRTSMSTQILQLKCYADYASSLRTHIPNKKKVRSTFLLQTYILGLESNTLPLPLKLNQNS